MLQSIKCTTNTLAPQPPPLHCWISSSSLPQLSRLLMVRIRVAEEMLERLGECPSLPPLPAGVSGVRVPLIEWLSGWALALLGLTRDTGVAMDARGFVAASPLPSEGRR